MTRFITAVAVLGLVATPVLATPCRDGKGKFVRCATAAPVKANRCKDAKGKFAKCGVAGAKPV